MNSVISTDTPGWGEGLLIAGEQVFVGFAAQARPRPTPAHRTARAAVPLRETAPDAPGAVGLGLLTPGWLSVTLHYVAGCRRILERSVSN